jgi:hypothetical protein
MALLLQHHSRGLSMRSQKNREALLSKIDPAKRAFVGKLLRSAAFAAPIVASFAMEDMAVADALPGNGSLR